jgi:cytochrome c-type biogenesis protein
MELQIGLAFIAGLVSFLSPCTLPLYPAYLSRLTGLSYSDIRDNHNTGKVRAKLMSHTALFVLGISMIYLVLGFSATMIGDWFIQYRETIRITSGILFIIMGVILTGLYQPKWMIQDRRHTESKYKTGSYIGSFLLGLGFAAGWTPCIGPMLSSIIGMAALDPANGMVYMLVYIAGFAIPFFLFAYFFSVFKRIHAYSSILMKIGGSVLIVMGLLLITNKLAILAAYLNNLFNFTGFL